LCSKRTPARCEHLRRQHLHGALTPPPPHTLALPLARSLSPSLFLTHACTRSLPSFLPPSLPPRPLQEGFIVDKEDSSVTRSAEYLEGLFKAGGLQVVRCPRPRRELCVAAAAGRFLSQLPNHGHTRPTIASCHIYCLLEFLSHGHNCPPMTVRVPGGGKYLRVSSVVLNASFIIISTI